MTFMMYLYLANGLGTIYDVCINFIVDYQFTSNSAE